MITLYGIKNCDTIKKARKWLEKNEVPYLFHDYKTQGVDASTLQNWCAELGYEILLNTRGTTWRKLPEEQKSNIDEERAIILMQANPSLIKRPILDNGMLRMVGFKSEEYESLITNNT